MPGTASLIGFVTAALVHVAAATGGLSALLLTSATAFSVAKTLGAGYLIYLGIRTLMAGDTTPGFGTSAHRSPHRLFRDGVVVSILNPKIAVFFLASRLRRLVGSRIVQGRMPRYASGAVYIGLGVSTALADRD